MAIINWRRRLPVLLLIGLVVGLAWSGAGTGRAAESVDRDGVARDRAALEAIYFAMDGPNWVVNTNWLSDEPLDEWHGVLTDEEGRVTALALYSLNIFGSIPVDGPSLRANELRGQIPSEIGQLDHLEALVLSNNRLRGPIPPELGRLTRLRSLRLDGNRLSGPIPPDLGDLTELRALVLMENPLSGTIPSEFGNLVNLEHLFLRSTGLSGPIPPELGRLSDLRNLDLRSTEVNGPIPAELGDLASLEGLYLARTDLSGPIPSELGQLRNLEELSLPSSLCAPTDSAFQTWLDGLDEAHVSPCVSPEEDSAVETPTTPAADQFEGTVESDREALTALYRATDGPDWVIKTNWLSDRPLGEWYGVETDQTGRVTALRLYTIDGDKPSGNSGHLTSNGLRGRIPSQLGQLDQLQTLVLWGNSLSGPIPPELGNLASLETLDLSSNRLSGRVPAELGKLSKLGQLELGSNWLRGPLPDELQGLANLTSLNLSRNSFPGPFPRVVLELRNLRSLDLSWTGISGPIPAELAGLSGLRQLSLDHNELSGPIPPELARLYSLQFLFLHNNQLGDALPAELGSLYRLSRLDLRNNQLSGALPDEIGHMRGLYELRLSGNEHLSGMLPVSFFALSSLSTLELTGTGLCAHGGATFQAWLAGVWRREGVTNCGPPPVNPDRDTLIAFYHAAGGPDWVFNTNWLSDRPLGEWYGVNTDGFGRVTRLMLYTIDGDKPLDSRGSSLTGNGLSGEIPASIGQLTELGWLLLADSDLSGSLPEELGNLRRLHSLYLNANPDLSGPLPGSLRGLTELSQLSVAGTQLCAPADWMFQSWLRELEHHEGIVNCAATGQISDREALTAFYHTTDGPNWEDSTNWLSDRPLGEWHGVTTDGDGRVIELSLYRPDWIQPVDSGESRGYGLRGSIPAEIGHLDRLQRLDLRNNNLSGTIPTQVGELGELRVLLLDRNWLSGLIPLQLGELVKLERLSLGSNNLDGPIPIELGNLSELTLLRLDRNKLSGRIPVQLSHLSNLKELHLERNRLGGSIPSQLGRLTNVQRLSLSGNYLGGTIPPQLGRLTELAVLYLGGNQLSGPIPPELGALSKLTRLTLSDSRGLEGPLPLALRNLTSLRFLWLDGSALCAPADRDFGTWLDGIERRHDAPTCPAPAEHDDREALVALYRATDGPNWVFDDHWLSDRPLHEWYGVTTDGWGRVTELSLVTQDGDQRVGSLDNEDVELTGNGLRGPIPATIGRLDRLRYLLLPGNQLRGSVPPELSQLSNLQLLELSDNPDLTGPLPSSFSGLTGLDFLALERTGLCLPGDAAVQEWLEGIQYEGDAPACEASGSNHDRSR